MNILPDAFLCLNANAATMLELAVHLVPSGSPQEVELGT